jgi:hypothetical protein
VGTNEFKRSLEKSLQQLNFVSSYRLKIEELVVDGELFIECNCFVKIRFTENWLTFSFALIIDNQRIWAIDKDNRLGWHRHPMNQVQIHESIAAQTIEEIVEELKSVWEEIKSSRK